MPGELVCFTPTPLGDLMNVAAYALQTPTCDSALSQIAAVYNEMGTRCNVVLPNDQITTIGYLRECLQPTFRLFVMERMFNEFEAVVEDYLSPRGDQTAAAINSFFSENQFPPEEDLGFGAPYCVSPQPLDVRDVLKEDDSVRKNRDAATAIILRHHLEKVNWAAVTSAGIFVAADHSEFIDVLRGLHTFCLENPNYDPIWGNGTPKGQTATLDLIGKILESIQGIAGKQGQG